MDAYIVAGYRSAVGKAPKGQFRFMRADDLGCCVIEHLMKEVPGLDKDSVDDVIVGNAMPEAEQGLNIGRMISLMGLNTDKVPVRDYQSDKALLCNLPSILMLFQNGSKSNHK